LRAKLEAVGWVMVRFLRRGHSLDKTGSHSCDTHHQEHLLRRNGSSTTDMHESVGNGAGAGGTPPLPNGRAAAAGARSRLARDGPPSGAPCSSGIFQLLCFMTSSLIFDDLTMRMRLLLGLLGIILVQSWT
jgi:hypothetical protein